MTVSACVLHIVFLLFVNLVSHLGIWKEIPSCKIVMSGYGRRLIAYKGGHV